MKLTIALVIVTLISTAGFVYVSLKQLDKQFYLAEKEKFDSLRRDFYYLVQQKSLQLTIYAEQIATLSHTTKDLSVFTDLVEISWEDLELLANLKSLHYYEFDKAKPSLSLGHISTDTTLSLAQEAIRSSEPQQQVRCEQYCSIIVSIPVQGDTNRGAIVLEQTLVETLMALAQLNQLEVGLLSAYSSDTENLKNYLPNWRLRTSIITNERTIFPFLSQVANTYPLDSLIRQGVVEKSPLGEYIIWAVPLTDLLNSSHYLLILNEVTESRYAIEQHINYTIIGALATIVIVSLMAIAFTIVPIQKIQTLIRQFDRIAKRQFKLVKESLPIKHRKHPDEIDILYREFVDLVKKLEVLDSDVQKKTAELKHQAMHDKLTNLGNRNLFMYELQKTVISTHRTPKNWALVFLDLDKFKLVNDNLGHDVGDELLKAVAHRLTDCLRNTDVVCRLGGDEFTIILYRLKRREDISIVMDKIFSVLHQPLTLGGKQLNIGCSAGVVLCDEEMLDADKALKSADMAMYDSKRCGRNRYKIFDEEMSHSAEQNFMIENEFANALIHNQFTLLLQPELNISDGTLYGFEALIRWQHPHLGIVLPAKFIPILEESDRINQLGRWVAKEAIRMLADLCKVIPNIKIAINISSRQVTDELFLPLITELCFDNNIQPSQLIMEITESVLIDDIENAKTWISEVQRKGFKLAIDDFGTGYSSLSYLSNLSFDIVKLDRSFIEKLSHSKNDKEILASVINMVQKMHRDVVAEGVETPEQLSLLKQLGCDIAQGFLIQHPTKFSEIQENIKNYNASDAWPTVETIIKMKHINVDH